MRAFQARDHVWILSAPRLLLQNNLLALRLFVPTILENETIEDFSLFLNNLFNALTFLLLCTTPNEILRALDMLVRAPTLEIVRVKV